MHPTLPIVPSSRSFQKNNTGFTLLEVLIALAIFALLSSAIAGQMSSSLRVQTSLESKRVASQLLENTLEQYQMMEGLAPAGRNRKVVKYADQYWHVETLIEDTPRSDMRSIDVAVYAANSAHQRLASEIAGNAAAQITAYLGAH